MPDEPLLRVQHASVRFGSVHAVEAASLDLWPGEVVAIVGESGSGKTTLLRAIAGRVPLAGGDVHYRSGAQWRSIPRLPERERRALMRSEWGFVEQHAHEGLRMAVSAGANIAERPMDGGVRRYEDLRHTALDWMRRVELDPSRIDDTPRSFSGGMRQRLQIARNLVSRPKLVLLDEPTAALDVSVQARLLDLLRGLVEGLGLAALIVTHDLGVARLLAQRTLVMKGGRIVEQGLTDRVLDDPQHPYTQLLVSSVVAA